MADCLHLNEEFPEAIQTIKTNAGYEKKANVNQLRFTSLKDIERIKRRKAIQEYIENIRQTNSLHVVIFIDVVTDCVSNFNDPAESMALYDYLGNLCERYNTTIFLVIHENPNSQKARGHAGTEAVNKSSTCIHIGFEKNKNGELSDLIWIKNFKNRSDAKFSPIAVQFLPETKSLSYADPTMIKSVTDQRRSKADINEVAQKLGMYLKTPLKQGPLMKLLSASFSCAENTLKARLTEIADSKIKILNENNEVCSLNIKFSNGSFTSYELLVEGN